MSGKSTMAIFAIGVLGMVALGLITKYALDSSPVLAEVTRVKKDLARDLEEHELEGISVRTLPQRAGYRVHFTFGRTPAMQDLEVFAEELASDFVHQFKGSRRPTVEVVVARSASLGCGADEVLAEQSFRTGELIQKRKRAVLSRALVGLEERSGRFRISAVEDSEDGSLRVTVLWAGEEKDPSEDEIGAFIYARLVDVSVPRLHLVVRSSSGPDTILKEVDVERPAARPRFHPRRRGNPTRSN